MTSTSTPTTTPPVASTGDAKLAKLFGLDGANWMRHANPVSVGTRFAVLPLLAVSIWSRDWMGWWSLAPIGLSIVFMMVNPLLFAPPKSTRNWASKGVFGERIWADRNRVQLPAQYTARIPNVTYAFQLAGLALLTYGLIVLGTPGLLYTVAGIVIVQCAKAWFIDRMVLLFEDMKTTHTPSTPDGSTEMNFLLVHGAWHTAAHWNRVAEHLATAGHRVYAMDLPGSGLDAGYPRSYLENDFGGLATELSPLSDIHLADYRDAVVAKVRELARHEPVTLVGHSFGGLAITLAAEAVPDLLRRIVYVSAYVPVRYATGADYSQLPEAQSSISGAVLIGDPTKTGAMRINPRDPDPEYVEKGRQAFYNDVPTEDYLRFAAFLNPDLPLAVAFDDARGTPERWGTIPRTFVRLSEDHTIPPALQDRMIAEADAATPGNAFAVHSLPSSHSPFASMPGRLADVLSR